MSRFNDSCHPRWGPELGSWLLDLSWAMSNLADTWKVNQYMEALFTCDCQINNNKYSKTCEMVVLGITISLFIKCLLLCLYISAVIHDLLYLKNHKIHRRHCTIHAGNSTDFLLEWLNWWE